MTRPLTERQVRALKLVGLGFVPRYVERSVPSLAGRGLVVVEKKGGRLTGVVTLTDAGRAILAEAASRDEQLYSDIVAKRDERGSATLEFLLMLGILWFPMMGLIATTSWPERLNAAHVAAYEAAKAAVSAPDPVAGEDVGRARAAEVITNHGFDASDVVVIYSLSDPRRGDQVTATVTVTLPALTFPGVGRWDAVRFSKSSTQRVGDFRGFR